MTEITIYLKIFYNRINPVLKTGFELKPVLKTGYEMKPVVVNRF